LHKEFDAWLKEQFPDENRLALVDLHSGQTWFALPEALMMTFTEDCSGLILFTDEGRYDYDVPPRWQYFTPWAWAALGVWLSLVAIWWKLRKRPWLGAVVT
jgi:hypothetical protein